MIIYFEICFDDDTDYRIENITPSNSLIMGPDDSCGYMMNLAESDYGDTFTVLLDLNRTKYYAEGKILPILYKVKFEYLRSHKLNKILNNIKWKR